MSVIVSAVEIWVLLFALYAMGVGLFGVFTRKPPRERAPAVRFAVIVPAHNEETVIEPLLKSLAAQRYPDDLYQVFVVADNCTDNTARVASATGVARVIERVDKEHRGKGWALQYALDRLGFLSPGASSFDAAVVFDADNLVEPGFLKAMNDRLLAGETLIQSFIDSKNPNDSWVSAATSVMFWLNNRLILQSRHNLGLCAALSGTGMCIAREVLETVGWSTHTLTEDLEYSAKAMSYGYPTTVAAETRTYDEKPLTFRASCRQRLRWARGQVDVAVRYVPRLLAAGLRRMSIAEVEAGLRLCQLFVLLTGSALTLLGLISPDLLRVGRVIYGTVSSSPPLALALPWIPYVLPLIVLSVDSPPVRPFRFFPLFPLYMYSWIALIAVGMATFRHRAWMPTEHSRDLSHEDVMSVQGPGKAPSTGSIGSPDPVCTPGDFALRFWVRGGGSDSGEEENPRRRGRSAGVRARPRLPGTRGVRGHRGPQRHHGPEHGAE